jgi:LacI family transcriptional regulator
MSFVQGGRKVRVNGLILPGLPFPDNSPGRNKVAVSRKSGRFGPVKPLSVYFSSAIRTSFEQGILRGLARYARTRSPMWKLQWGPVEWITPEQAIDGIVAFALNEAEFRRLSATGIPLVCTSTRNLGMGRPCVVTDDAAIGALAAQHFLSRYYRSFAYVGPMGIPFSHGRHRGFADKLPGGDCPVFWMNDLTGTETSDRDLVDFLAGLPKSTGIFTANDVFARRVVRLLEPTDRHVPRDLAVLGVDADEMVSFSSPLSLSSVDSDPAAIGHRAAFLLERLMADPTAVSPDHVERIPPVGLVPGHSTDALATDDPLVLRAVAILRERACGGLGIDELARECGCSRRSLETRFAAVTGIGIAAHIRQLKLERAKELLRGSALPVYEVAAQAGFCSPYHFSDTFKKALGQTPLQYRKGGG